jgi:hypothetical protein
LLTAPLLVGLNRVAEVVQTKPQRNRLLEPELGQLTNAVFAYEKKEEGSCNGGKLSS